MRDGGDPESNIETVDVLEENWDTVQVFMQCRPQWLTGFHAPVYAGVTAQELEAALRLLQIPSTDHPDVISGIRVMVEETKSLHNNATT